MGLVHGPWMLGICVGAELSSNPLYLGSRLSQWCGIVIQRLIDAIATYGSHAWKPRATATAKKGRPKNHTRSARGLRM